MAPFPQAAGALLHPVTLIAIAVLLLNDHVFKHTWPGTWWTGKLSDIAWMVFALPALAVIIALIAPRAPRWSSRVFVIAYGGLSLLYLAYNLNEPLHDVIMSAFALLTKAENTSPFDPTDAIVILPTLAIATWVWRSGRKPPQLRRIPAMAVVTVAVLASVATSYGPDSQGVLELDADVEEGMLFASVCFADSYGHDFFYEVKDVYVSFDGGFTWSRSGDRPNDGCRPEEGARSLETHRGTIELRPGKGVFLIKDGIATLEVDTSFMDDPVVEALTYEQLADRRVFVRNGLSLGLFDVEAAPSGGNVVVATGHNGVLVGLPDGSWEWVNVGPYAATSQSPAARRGLLASFSNILTILVAGFLGAAVPFLLKATFSPSNVRRHGSKAGLIVAAVFLTALAVMWSSFFWQLGRWSPNYPPTPICLLVAFSIFIIPVTVILLTMVSYDSYSDSIKIKATCAISGVLSGIAVIFSLWLWTEAAIPSLTLAKVISWASVMAISATAVYILRRIKLPDHGHSIEEESESR